MYNKYFQAMRKKGVAFLKQFKNSSSVCNSSLYSEGESKAFMYWAISDYYSSTEIVVDDLPLEKELDTFIETFRKANIHVLVLINKAEKQIKKLENRGCTIVGLCKVFQQETMLYRGELEIIKGTKILL